MANTFKVQVNIAAEPAQAEVPYVVYTGSK